MKLETLSQYVDKFQEAAVLMLVKRNLLWISARGALTIGEADATTQQFSKNKSMSRISIATKDYLIEQDSVFASDLVAIKLAGKNDIYINRYLESFLGDSDHYTNLRKKLKAFNLANPGVIPRQLESKIDAWRREGRELTEEFEKLIKPLSIGDQHRLLELMTRSNERASEAAAKSRW